jgi:hypothetical protein
MMSIGMMSIGMMSIGMMRFELIRVRQSLTSVLAARSIYEMT